MSDSLSTSKVLQYCWNINAFPVFVFVLWRTDVSNWLFQVPLYDENELQVSQELPAAIMEVDVLVAIL